MKVVLFILLGMVYLVLSLFVTVGRFTVPWLSKKVSPVLSGILGLLFLYSLMRDVRNESEV